MQKAYEPHAIEKKWYAIWEKGNYFEPNMQAENAYCILLPPPNITGSLHMGHGFQHTLMDALIRYHRMLGENVLWQAGTDHASIATQMIVEKQLAQENKTRHDLGREKFLERVWDWKQESGDMITQQMRRMGSSIAWPHERFTMDPEYSKAVTKVFIDLYREGLIYRGKRLVNWDPHQLTAISDLEVISAEEQGTLWYIRYPIIDTNEFIIVATTRPETMFGDVAVAVHPDDERYQKFIGKHIALPLTDRKIPIISDDAVISTFGSGCVKITPAHDFNDYAMAHRHKLPLMNIFTPNAYLNDQVPAEYQGLERFEARKKILANLEKLNLLEKTESYTVRIPRAERTGVIIEPMLTEQWFMRMKNLAEPAIKAVQNGDVKFIPENWNNTYFQWLNQIEDWCISRQLWWGHRIPAWHDEAGKIYVGESEEAIRKKNNLSSSIKLTQDIDVLDTWFSAGLWPFVTLGWPEKTEKLKKFYPTNVLVTGFDIIFFWVARMIMLGLKFMGEVPFKEVYITGLIRDHDGQKMSKTKGNVIDPIDIIDGIDLPSLLKKRTSGLIVSSATEKIKQATQKQFPKGIPSFGTDALRFTYCALASPTRDIRFDLGRVEGYRNFCNKIWNATRYVLMNIENTDFNSGEKIFSQTDEWILSCLSEVLQNVAEHFKNYRFDLIANALYEFTWNEYCDWYLELTKPILLNPQTSDAQKNGTCYTLVFVLENLLRALHPLMSFITEEIWQQVSPLLGKKGKSIVFEAYPSSDIHKVNHEAVAELEWVKSVITGIRSLRSEMNINPGKMITAICAEGTALDKKRIESHRNLITKLAKLESITWGNAQAKSAIVLVGELKILIPLEGLIDLTAEKQRLEKEIENLKLNHRKIAEKLLNNQFVQNAPKEVVQKEEERIILSKSKIEELTKQLRILLNETKEPEENKNNIEKPFTPSNG